MLPVLLLLLGVGLIAYPFIASGLETGRQSQVYSEYNQALRQNPSLQQILEDARQYNRALASGEIPGKAYEDMLNPTGNGVMGYVIVPKLNLTLPIRHGTGEEALRTGTGHLPQTSLPVGGKGTHAAISAHSGMAGAEMFTGLSKLQIGDVFYIEVCGLRLTYEVDRIQTVLPSDTSALEIDPKQDYCTLVTCTPFGVNTHRLLVRGHRVA